MSEVAGQDVASQEVESQDVASQHVDLDDTDAADFDHEVLKPEQPKPALSIPPACRLSFYSLQKFYALGDQEGEKVVFVNVELLRLALDLIADRVLVDETWYREMYPDIAQAIEEGKFRDAKHHYMVFGYSENRIPHFIPVDEAFYRLNNPDIAAGLVSGAIESCQWHFETFGFREGRLPYVDWTLY